MKSKLTLKKFIKLFFFLVLLQLLIFCSKAQDYIPANDSKIHYMGRIDFSDSLQPKYSFPGVSIKAKFSGSGISAIIHDYGIGGEGTTNYYKIIINGNIIISYSDILFDKQILIKDTGKPFQLFYYRILHYHQELLNLSQQYKPLTIKKILFSDLSVCNKY